MLRIPHKKNIKRPNKNCLNFKKINTLNLLEYSYQKIRCSNWITFLYVGQPTAQEIRIDGENPGTPFIHIHTRARNDSHAHAPTHADESKKIAEPWWQVIAGTHTHTHALTHTHAHTQARMHARTRAHIHSNVWPKLRPDTDETHTYTKPPPKFMREQCRDDER